MSVPAEYLGIIEKLISHYQISDQALTDLVQELINDKQNQSIPNPVFTDLVARLYLLTADPSLSFEFGKLIGSNAQGFFGYAIKASENLEQAILFEEKYMPVIFDTLNMKLNTIGTDKFSIEIEYKAPELFIPFLSELVASSFVQAFTDLAGKRNRVRVIENFKAFELKLSYAPPEYAELYQRYIPFKVSFDQAFNEIIGPQGLLYQKNKNYDPNLHKLMVDQFDIKLENKRNDSISSKIKHLLKEKIGNEPNIQQASATLNMSERTLRRKLSVENTSFRNILLDTRMEESKILIKKGELNLEQIAYKLGYQHPSTFSSAFKKRYSISPKEYKESL